MILRCTLKARTFLGAGKSKLVDAEPAATDWYLNLIWFERRKCLLLTHAGTLYSVFVVDVRKADVADLDDFIHGCIKRSRQAEGLPFNTFGDPMPSPVQVAKTVDRTVVGCMVEQAYLRVTILTQAGGIGACDPDSLNRELHRTIHQTIEYRSPIELARQWALMNSAGAFKA